LLELFPGPSRLYLPALLRFLGSIACHCAGIGDVRSVLQYGKLQLLSLLDQGAKV
jgi:hypothetical protein